MLKWVFFHGGIAQLVERLVRNEKARGSNPLTSKSRRRRLETPTGMRTQFEREAQIERSEINPLTSKSRRRRLETPTGMRTAPFCVSRTSRAETKSLSGGRRGDPSLFRGTQQGGSSRSGATFLRANRDGQIAIHL
jgi:hypothetical protein